MVHYYNAPMTEHAWMRDEERAFLANLGGVFDGTRAEALRETAALLALDYVGIDCAIDRDGNVLLFEADNALLVHVLDDPAMFPYKHEYVPRIHAALDAMVRREITRVSLDPSDWSAFRALLHEPRMRSSTTSSTCATVRRGVPCRRRSKRRWRSRRARKASRSKRRSRASTS